MSMYMLQIQVHQYFSACGSTVPLADATVPASDPRVGDNVEIDLRRSGTVLLYYTLFSLYWD